MAALIFILTFLSLVVLLVVLIVKAVRGKPIIAIFKSISFIILGYGIAWTIFYLVRTDIPVPLGTDVCFDDWCATIIKIESGPAVQKQFSTISRDSTWIILDITVSNHARGIAQKPS